ncbi:MULTISPECIES: ABC transporter substrate-binding protein [unclassified Brenneria]|uniref:ABC transporter substrate-binding protein n=1 Tax=unclassified Brenneria TaxID=2634434 RepID=UPI001557B8C0|nr:MULTISPECIES: ABC transporter substrate-binding protein [unclassified Brenneria]MBJ7222250.1 ABC transporter substrate-binding protein [Brenneria sp. L3-3C-1]MEE3643493.1 ABC transporter substrate-binding protein [Brenneria sp. L3_3C_1]MEE3651677.1 ABC transporter substrate-binding protein [Brenneria sp. HEZEL_4_2_4]NPD01634.1 ABC transporter substrate-binding protein [Brenneria sp. hezel4-2-4]
MTRSLARRIQHYALSALLIGCASYSYAGKQNDTLVYASDNEVENISPYHNTLREGVIISNLVWDRLVYRDPKTGEYEPQLAAAWEWDSPEILVLHLRKGIKFHNGDDFTADDVVYTFNNIAGDNTDSVMPQSVNWIKETEKVDDYTVKLHLEKPFPAALEYLSGPTPIYPAKYYQQVKLAGFSKAPIGTGPYKVTGVTPAQGVTMEKNPDYFKESPVGQPKIGKLQFVVIRDPETRLAQLMTGQVDWIWRVPADQMTSLETMPNLSVKSGETMRIGFLALNTHASGPGGEPFKDLRVRQAVNHAINRQGMVDNLVRGGSQPVYSACFSAQAACNTSKVIKYEYNPEKAKQLLAEAGYPNGFDTDIWAYRERDYAEAIIGDLRKVGINARLHYVQHSVLAADLISGKAPMAVRTWGSYSINDASAFVTPYFGGKGDDIWKDAEVTSMLNQADETIDTKQRSAMYADVLGRISSQAYLAPLFSYSTNYAFTSDLNFDSWPDELPRFALASWK